MKKFGSLTYSAGVACVTAAVMTLTPPVAQAQADAEISELITTFTETAELSSQLVGIGQQLQDVPGGAAGPLGSVSDFGLKLAEIFPFLRRESPRSDCGLTKRDIRTMRAFYPDSYVVDVGSDPVTCVVDFDLHGKYSRFQTVTGEADPGPHGERMGSDVFVYVDGQLRQQTSATFRRDTLIDVDVRGANTIRLVFKGRGGGTQAGAGYPSYPLISNPKMF